MRALALPLLLVGCVPDADHVHVEEPEEPVVEPGPCPALPAGVSSGSVGDLDRVRDVDFTRRVVLMGGGTEVDRATQLFVEGAHGHDVLVLRASGSTESYTSYFSTELSYATPAASVTTLLLDDPALAADPAVLCFVDGAEAIWLAGGDQADYLVRWPNALRDALSRAVDDGVTLGGTSAGAMAFGGFAFDAAEGSVTSDEALAAPTSPLVSVTASPIAPEELGDVVVDTHFVARGREGRLLAFLDRVLVDGAAGVVGLGLDESSALVVDGDAFTVLTGEGAQAFLYRAAGPESPEDGALDLDDVERVTLNDGDSGAWPPELAAFDSRVEIVVEDGSVSER